MLGAITGFGLNKERVNDALAHSGTPVAPLRRICRRLRLRRGLDLALDLGGIVMFQCKENFFQKSQVVLDVLARPRHLLFTIENLSRKSHREVLLSLFMSIQKLELNSLDHRSDVPRLRYILTIT